MTSGAVSVEGLSKQYQLGEGRESYYTLRDALARWGPRALRRIKNGEAAREETIWALRDVTFEVQPGEVVGLIGRNGAGKSTLLKVLSRITEPTSGRARIRGRVASLLEVGTGFHAELTGRENLYLNGAILGMSKGEIVRKFDEIVAFAEVEKFIDTPVKRYSSGMYLRLAFSIAAHLDPEILIVDEVLAVGDLTFQARCIGRMEQVARQGRTVLFVSHHMAAVQALCARCIWLRGGEVAFDGPSAETIARYTSQDVAQAATVNLVDHPNRPAKRQNGPLRFLTLLGQDGKPTPAVRCGERITLKIDVEVPSTIRAPRAVLWFGTVGGLELFTLDSVLQQHQLPSVEGAFSLCCSLPELPLAPGSYTVSVSFGDTARFHEQVERALTFEVQPADFFGVGKLPPRERSHVLLRSDWRVAPS